VKAIVTIQRQQHFCTSKRIIIIIPVARFSPMAKGIEA
jgi:hypothetical protein